ncbi:HlyD family secretion protein [Paracoccus sp. (in: a-proteobacteria)]|uniref:HlyD family secretion protein n=1 Tax=Paracoccus sp. TaxID=267 RepID=UPI0026E06C4D|nr:HlyD family efflux transporter periplasmic adaptor subunit [Paracoccus sp. (in: a-proteobacteria)]MDO5647248.1 HlyD family efflux transporter periplasmic adaptor subunit [Paracoccus sp. (in: a-proteobacteria)]
MRIAFVFCLLVVLALGAFFTPLPAHAQDGPWIAVARGTVDAQGGLMRLAAQREGLIAQVMAEEGDHVTAGQPLARLDDAGAALQLALTVAEVEQAETQVALAQMRADHAQADADRLRPLARSDAVPQRQIDEANRTARITALELTAAQQSAALARQRIAVQQAEIDARVITAPVDGVILRRAARPGDATSTATVTEMFLLAPDGPRVLRAQLDEQFVGLVTPGQRAEVIRERDDGTRLSGTVQRVAPVFGSATPGARTGDDARTVDITITLDGPAAELERLVLGQRMIARILK